MALIKNLTAWLACVLAAVIILFAVRIDGFFIKTRGYDTGQNDIFYKMFGEFRNTIAAMLYLKADTYYHGGTVHEHDEESENGHGLCVERARDNKEPAEHEHSVPGGPVPGDLFSRIYCAITQRPVIHLKDLKSAEIMPWFELATLADPHYIPAYAVGGYWLGMRLHKPKRALIFLKKGLKYNQDSWQIYEQIADIYFLVYKDYSKSIAYLRRAYLLMNTAGAEVLEKKRVLIFLAASFERTGEYAQSLYYYEKLNAISGHDEMVEKKIMQLKQKSAEGVIN